MGGLAANFVHCRFQGKAKPLQHIPARGSSQPAPPRKAKGFFGFRADTSGSPNLHGKFCWDATRVQEEGAAVCSRGRGSPLGSGRAALPSPNSPSGSISILLSPLPQLLRCSGRRLTRKSGQLLPQKATSRAGRRRWGGRAAPWLSRARFLSGGCISPGGTGGGGGGQARWGGRLQKAPRQLAPHRCRRRHRRGCASPVGAGGEERAKAPGAAAAHRLWGRLRFRFPPLPSLSQERETLLGRTEGRGDCG